MNGLPVKPIKRTKCSQKISGERRTAAARSEKRIHPLDFCQKLLCWMFFVQKNSAAANSDYTAKNYCRRSCRASDTSRGHLAVFVGCLCRFADFDFCTSRREPCVSVTITLCLFVVARCSWIFFNCLPAFIALLSKWPLFAR